MKPSKTIIYLMLFLSLAACSEPQDAAVSIDPTVTYNAFEDASKNPDARITHVATGQLFPGWKRVIACTGLLRRM